MPLYVRRVCLNEWDGMAEVVDMLTEVKREEQEEMEGEANLTREPETDEENEEEEEIDYGKSPEHWDFFERTYDRTITTSRRRDDRNEVECQGERWLKNE